MNFDKSLHFNSKPFHIILYFLLLFYLFQTCTSSILPTFFKQDCIDGINCSFEPDSIQPKPTPINSGTKLTGEVCRKDTECKGTRQCIQESSDENPSSTSCEADREDLSNRCFCLPKELRKCKVDADCNDEEICDSESTIEFNFCRSPTIDQQQGIGSKLTGQLCHDDFDCRTPRLCFSPNLAELCRPFGQNVTKDDDAESSCVCRPLRLTRCEVSRDCQKGEYCGNVDGQDSGLRVCLANDIKALPSELRREGGMNETIGSKSSGVCMDSKLLKELDKEELVFKDDILADVLCDEFDSCATAGHMIVWNGSSMMMKRYCTKQGIKCRKEVIYVNSPKWRMGRRIESYTEGLELTAIAARFESRIEETILRSVIHAGA